jgi:hypothetical protein
MLFLSNFVHFVGSDSHFLELQSYCYGKITAHRAGTYFPLHSFTTPKILSTTYTSYWQAILEKTNKDRVSMNSGVAKFDSVRPCSCQLNTLSQHQSWHTIPNMSLTLSRWDPWKYSGRWSTWRGDHRYPNQLHTDADRCRSHHTFLPAFLVPVATQTCSQTGHARTCNCLFGIREATNHLEIIQRIIHFQHSELAKLILYLSEWSITLLNNQYSQT